MPTFSACTGVYTNHLLSCSGDTVMSLSTGAIYFNNNIQVNNGISGDTVYANTYFSGDTNLLDVFKSVDSYVTGGTLSGNTIILDRSDNGQVSIDLTDIRFSGGSTNCITDFYVTNIHGCSPVTIHDELIVLSGITMNLPNIDNNLYQMIVRDTVSGELKYRDVQSIISATTELIPIVTGFTYNDANEFTITDSHGTAYTANFSVISGITTTGDILPQTDNTVDLGTTLKRFRNINTVKGESTLWVTDSLSATSITATTIDLGLDSQSNSRIITANTSILNNDCLDGSTY